MAEEMLPLFITVARKEKTAANLLSKKLENLSLSDIIVESWSVVNEKSVLNLLPKKARNTLLSVTCLSVVSSKEIRDLPPCITIAKRRKAAANLLPEKGFRLLYDVVQAVSRSSPVTAIKEEVKKIIVSSACTKGPIPFQEKQPKT